MQEIITEINTLLENYQSYAEKTKLSNQDQTQLQLLESAEKTIMKLGQARQAANQKFGNSNILSVIDILENFKLGNCYENAKVAEVILLLNGIKNAGIARLKTFLGQPINHVVCLFNKDGSPYDGNINKHTIVIDNWAGKADFANNMINFYKTQFKEYFNIPINEQVEFIEFSKTEIPENTLDHLRHRFPSFIYNENSQFMA